MNAIKLRIAGKSDLVFISHLQKKFSNQLGFLPTAALREYLASARVIMALENDAPAAYLLFRTTTRKDAGAVTIVQAAVELDAQRRHVGVALVDRLITRSQERAKTSIQCNCAADIEAKHFWLAVGFEQHTAAWSLSQRGRTLITFKRAISR